MELEANNRETQIELHVCVCVCVSPSVILVKKANLYVWFQASFVSYVWLALICGIYQ